MLRHLTRLFSLCVLGLWLASPVLAQDTTSNLVLHWTLNDGAGSPTTADASGTGNTGTLQGAPVWTTGQLGGALQLAAGDHVERLTGISLPIGATAAFTLAGWVKAATYVNLAHLFGFGADVLGAASNTQRGMLTFNNNYYFWGAGSDWDTGIAFDTDNAWHHWALTASSTTVTFYRDGVQRATAARPGGMATAELVITFGRNHTAGAAFVGTGDDLRIYARELTAGDVAALFGVTAVARRRSILMLQ